MSFYQKYRPQKFADLVGQDHISQTLRESIKRDCLTHAYLLTGPRGIGKTTTARLLAKAINCRDSTDRAKSGEPCNQCDYCVSISGGRALDVIEIDAASHTSVDDIRDLIEKARLAPASARKKVYIIDEVHMLSKSAFNALLKTLEEPPPHVVFILATTEVQRLPETILSRTQRYDFRRASQSDIIANLKRVAAAEDIAVDTESLEILAVLARGAQRDAVGLLEQVAGYTNQITIASTRAILGLSSQEETFSYLRAVFNNLTEEGLKIAHRLYDQGSDMAVFYADVLELLRKILLYRASGEVLFEETESNVKKIKELGGRVATANLIKAVGCFIANSKLLKEVSNPVLPLEMATVEAAQFFSEPGTQNIELRSNSERTQNTGAEKKETKLETRAPSAKSRTPEPAIPDPGTAVDESVVKSPAPTPVLEMTDDLWLRLTQAVKEKNSTLAALLRDAKPIEVSQKKMVLGVKFPFHRDRISDAKNRQVLESILKDAVGAEYHLECRLVAPEKRKSTKTDDLNLEKAVGEVFETE
ncbi:MAG: DNA polymerase III subunit gamma/tau [Patescibacteria group bacterium]